MKKLIKLACIVFAISLTLTACGKKDDKDADTKTTKSSPVQSSQSQEVTTENPSEPTTVILNRPTTTTTAAPTTTSKRTTVIGSTPSQSQKSSAVQTTKKAVANPTYIKGVLVANKTYALPSGYNPGVDPAAQSAFNQMAAAASKEGINLYVVSGFRSYSTQANIYNNYVARDGKAAADRYSARPGHSEHQTGLAFDVNSLSQSFENTAEGKWLAANCHSYGFIIRYPKGKEGVTGYMYEPWHIRYLGTATAEAVYKSGLTLEEYLGINSVYSN